MNAVSWKWTQSRRDAENEIHQQAKTLVLFLDSLRRRGFATLRLSPTRQIHVWPCKITHFAHGRNRKQTIPDSV